MPKFFYPENAYRDGWEEGEGMSREQDILLTKRLFSAEVDRILERIKQSEGDDPVRRERIYQEAQQEFNRLDSWFARHVLQG